MLFLCLLFAISMENKFSANIRKKQKKNINKTVCLSAVEKQSQILRYYGLYWIKPLHLFSYLVIKSFWKNAVRCSTWNSVKEWKYGNCCDTILFDCALLKDLYICFALFIILYIFYYFCCDNERQRTINKHWQCFCIWIGLREMHNNMMQGI